jgi:hypothetical protein
MAQPLTERREVYTIGLDQFLRFFHGEGQSIFSTWEKMKIFGTMVPIYFPPARRR